MNVAVIVASSFTHGLSNKQDVRLGHECEVTWIYGRSHSFRRQWASPLCLHCVYFIVRLVSNGLNGNRVDAPWAIQFGLVWGSAYGKWKTHCCQLSTNGVRPGISK